MLTFLKHLHFGVRALRRMPGSALISVIVLALGIGLCSFMFSVVYGVFYRGLGVPEANRVFAVLSTIPEEDQFNAGVRIQDFGVFRERLTSFVELSAAAGGPVNVSDAGSAWRLNGAHITANTLGMLRVEPLLGRGFAAGEDAPGSPPNVLLGYVAWRDQFGMDSSVVGRVVRVNGEPAQILGVMPDGFQFPFNNDAWIPLRDDPRAVPRPDGRTVTVIGRLRDGVGRAEADREVAAIAEQIAQEFPESAGRGARIETPERTATGGPLVVIFGAMMVAVFCVLAVACANVANLLLARAATRTREGALRAALGGGRLNVMAPFLAEALVLSAAGAVLGIAVAHVAIGWFDGVTDPSRTGRPYFIRFTIDWPILAFVVGVTVMTALIAGLLPAIKVARADVSSVLKDQARGSSGLQIGRLSRILVTAEVALSCALLVGAGLMTKSILKLGATDYLFETERLFTARVALLEAEYPDRDSRERVWDDMLRELRSLPSVSAAALGSQLPMMGAPQAAVAIEGTSYDDAEALPQIARFVVSSGYFEAIGVQLSAGRDFAEPDAQGSERVAVVNRSMVERYFGGTNPLGRRFRERLGGPVELTALDTLPALTVVGVVPDLSGPPPGAGEDFEPAAYFVPLRQSNAQGLYVAAVPRSGEPLALTADVRAAVGRAAPEVPIFQVRTQAEVVDRATWSYGVFGTVFIVFGVAALFMASVGLYGVLAFAVSRRTQEMGIRMALGASSRDVIALVLRQGTTQLGIGLAIGMALAFGLTRVIGILMYEVDPQDPAVFAGVLLTIVLVGVAAAVFPAKRATRVDPVDALRSE